MDEARKALEKEVNVIEMIKSRRFVNMALHHLLQPAKHKELKARSHFIEVDSDHHSSEGYLDR